MSVAAIAVLNQQVLLSDSGFYGDGADSEPPNPESAWLSALDEAELSEQFPPVMAAEAGFLGKPIIFRRPHWDDVVHSGAFEFSAIDQRAIRPWEAVHFIMADTPADSEFELMPPTQATHSETRHGTDADSAADTNDPVPQQGFSGPIVVPQPDIVPSPQAEIERTNNRTIPGGEPLVGGPVQSTHVPAALEAQNSGWPLARMRPVFGFADEIRILPAEDAGPVALAEPAAFELRLSPRAPGMGLEAQQPAPPPALKEFQATGRVQPTISIAGTPDRDDVRQAPSIGATPERHEDAAHGLPPEPTKPVHSPRPNVGEAPAHENAKGDQDSRRQQDAGEGLANRRDQAQLPPSESFVAQGLESSSRMTPPEADRSTPEPRQFVPQIMFRREETPPAAIRAVNVEMSTPSLGNVKVRIFGTQNAMQIQVKSPDWEIRQSLRSGVMELVNRIEQLGLCVEEMSGSHPNNLALYESPGIKPVSALDSLGEQLTAANHGHEGRHPDSGRPSPDWDEAIRRNQQGRRRK